MPGSELRGVSTLVRGSHIAECDLSVYSAWSGTALCGDRLTDAAVMPGGDPVSCELCRREAGTKVAPDSRTPAGLETARLQAIGFGHRGSYPYRAFAAGMRVTTVASNEHVDYAFAQWYEANQ